MIEKSDGGFGYGTTDMAAIRNRLRDEKCDLLVYVTDLGQSGHFELVFGAAKKANFIPDGARIDHVGFGVVLNEDGTRIKTRAGRVFFSLVTHLLSLYTLLWIHLTLFLLQVIHLLSLYTFYTLRWVNMTWFLDSAKNDLSLHTLYPQCDSSDPMHHAILAVDSHVSPEVQLQCQAVQSASW